MVTVHQFQSAFLHYWTAQQRCLRDMPQHTVTLDGQSLDIPSIVAVARHGKGVDIDPQASARLQAAVDKIHKKLAEGEIIYGVNTGFGGSGSSRPSRVSGVQNSLMRMLNYGILADESPKHGARSIDEADTTTSMPESWVRAAMVIRINSLIQGVSGVRPLIVQNLVKALNQDIVPLVPLRGSISASGDLSPLSYIGGMLQGKRAIRVYDGIGSERRLCGADEALRRKNMEPIELLPKEGLAIVNGTAISSAVGALALYEAHCQAALSQVLTALSVESLRGSLESFDPFFAQVRPHPGQIEAAANIRSFLNGSKIAIDCGQREEMQQDRYSIRTAAQWLGPVLEDLALADRQIRVEVNSVTDNPLIGPEGKVLHGGNFQARAVTSAMEKVRQGCESIGQMLFAQCAEIMNPSTSNGLPPNLAIDEPQESWLWKGADIMIAALTSELGFLANAAGNHVKTAEMGNQALNSLALISARYTLTALDVLTQLSSVHVLACCQALDLRVVDIHFHARLKPCFTTAVSDHLISVISLSSDRVSFEQSLWSSFQEFWATNKGMNTADRISAALDRLDSLILKNCDRSVSTLDSLEALKKQIGAQARQIYSEVRHEYVAKPDATPFLGASSARVYSYVRFNLNIPFVSEGYLAEAEWDNPESQPGEATDAIPKYRSLGSMITALYSSMKSGEFYDVIAGCFSKAAEK